MNMPAVILTVIVDPGKPVSRYICEVVKTATLWYDERVSSLSK